MPDNRTNYLDLTIKCLVLWVPKQSNSLPEQDQNQLEELFSEIGPSKNLLTSTHSATTVYTKVGESINVINILGNLGIQLENWSPELSHETISVLLRQWSKSWAASMYENNLHKNATTNKFRMFRLKALTTLLRSFLSVL